MKLNITALLFLLSVVTFGQLNYKEVPPEPQNLQSLGSLNTIVILIKFQGESEFTSTRQTYDNMFNSLTAASLKGYYKEVSYNKLDITSYLYPSCAPTTNLSYVFPKPRGYFQAYSGTNTIGYTDTRQARLREHEILDSAVIFISTQIPAGLDLDFNNDGFVDNVMFIFKGSSGPWGDVGLWPHSGVLDSYDVRLNNKRVYHYSIHLETMTNVSTFCHESFHVFGAPDLYRYFTSGTPVGSWDIMASGSVSMGAYMKYKYTNHNWITNIPKITKSGTYTLSQISSDTNNCFRIDSPYSDDEFFILEYRYKTGLYESTLPGTGLLVYRINNAAGNGNGGGPPDEVYIYRPNGTTTSEGTISQANFSSTVGRTAINDYTSNPKSFLSNGQKAGLDIKNVGASGTTISFDVVIVTCSITSPANNSAFNKGDQVLITAAAGDSGKITKVEFFLDSVLVNTATNYPYQFQWNTSSYGFGSHSIKARATGISGVYKEDRIAVNLSDGKPVVQILSPADSVNVGIGDSIQVNVLVVSPHNKIATVKLYIDGTLKGESTTPPYNFLWKTTGYDWGKHTLKATALDSSGAEGFHQVSAFIIKYLVREGFENQWPPNYWYINSGNYGWYQSPKGSFAGEKCAATRNYHAMGEAILETPVIAVEQNTIMEFYWLDRTLDITAPLLIGHDTTYCEISVNGAPYTLLRILSATDPDASYRKENFNLSQYSGKNIKIRWRDVTDESLNAEGSALDEVKIISFPPPTGISDGKPVMSPWKFMLKQNYPNPFNPSTAIEFELAVKSDVELSVFNILGERISTLINREMEAGRHITNWNASSFPSGVYFYSLKAGNFREGKKMIMLK